MASYCRTDDWKSYDDLPLYLTSDEAARVCRVSPVTMKKRRSAGKPPAYIKVGGRLLYKKEVVLAFLESCTK